ncbi:MAG: hemolysin family protein [Parabacteroides sp.]|nr:hemolysin family protein [Parabacteroides sp.]
MELVLFYLFLALSVSFLCSVLEAVLLSTPISFITMKEQEGAKNAPLMMRLKQDIDKPISAILSLNTIAHTVGSAGVGAEAVKVFGEVYFGVISAILTILILVVSEIIPKTIGSYYWRQLAMPAASIIRVMIIISYPLVWLSEWITRLITFKKKTVSVSREEVSAMVSVGTKEGVFETSESEIIQNLFKLDSITVDEIMTPRTVTVMASENTDLKTFYKDKAHRMYSRIPVYKESPDFITGFVLLQTVLEELAEDHFDRQLKDIRHPILTFKEGIEVSYVWEAMLKRRMHIAQIQNEYGCFLGIVTMEDIIEAIIGREIVDENDMVDDLQAYAREKWKRQVVEDKP